MDAIEKEEEKRNGVLEMNNKHLANRSKINNYREKIKGRFKLRMSPNLSSPQKINKYAQEPLAFHIYK